MPFASNSAINGFSGSGSQKPQSTFASQASTLATQDNRDEMIRDVAQPDEGPGTSTERSLTVRDNQHEGYANPIEDLPLKDWKELEARYERDMEAAIQNEQTIMAEIEWVMKACDCESININADLEFSVDDEGVHDRFQQNRVREGYETVHGSCFCPSHH